MGLGLSSPRSTGPFLSDEELDALVRLTHFNELEIKKLFLHFKAISGSMQDDDTIELNEFKATLGRKDDTFTKRLFQVFDTDRNDHVDFREFALGVSALSERGTVDERIKYSFKIYDIDNDGFIDKGELHQMLKASLLEHNDFSLSEEQIQVLVENTFAEVCADHDDRISFQEYDNMIRQNPSVLDSLTIKTVDLI